MFDVKSHKPKLEGAIVFFKQDIGALRTGRATPALVENLSVEAYGSRSPLIQLASISAPDPKTILIQPWDKSMLKEIEKAIHSSDLNLSPAVDSTVIRISIPPLSEENRKNLVKLLHEKAEQCRVALRQQRERIRSEIGTAESGGGITEDEKFQAQKNLDDLIKEYTDQVKLICETKEREIMTI